MDNLIQNEILNLVLLSFEENSEAKKRAINASYQEYDRLIAEAQGDTLSKTVVFIDFIDKEGMMRFEKNPVFGLVYIADPAAPAICCCRF